MGVHDRNFIRSEWKAELCVLRVKSIFLNDKCDFEKLFPLKFNPISTERKIMRVYIMFTLQSSLRHVANMFRFLMSTNMPRVLFQTFAERPVYYRRFIFFFGPILALIIIIIYICILFVSLLLLFIFILLFVSL